MAEKAEETDVKRAVETVRRASFAAKDQILANISQALFGYTVTVNLEDGSFMLIAGTGTEDAVACMESAKDYRGLYTGMMARVRPEDRDRLREFLSLDYLRMNRGRPGFYGTQSYQVIGDDETAPWEEASVLFATDGNGRPIANILGRDITEAHRETARHEREMKAAQAKDQLLAGVTQALYGFNVTVNLARNTFSLIRGTGTERICEIFEEHLGRPYTEVAEVLIRHVPPEFRQEAYRSFGRDILLGHRHRSGHLGQREFPWGEADGAGLWFEVNAFMSMNESGEPVINLLGRNATARHLEQERREREARAVAVKDQILSGITKSLYGYNITINLETLQCSVIRGTGMDCIVDLVERIRDYSAIREAVRERIPSEADFEEADELLSPKSMRALAEKGVNGFAGRVEYEDVCPVHGRHWHRANLFIGRDENGVPTANILSRDVTEEHNLHDAEAKLRIAEQANKAKSEFLFNMSHDVRTPMHAIMGFVDIAAQDIDDKASVRTCLDKIRKSGDLLFSLLNSVLDMSRIEVGRAKLVESVGDVRNSFEGIRTTMTEVAREKNISLSFEFGEITDRYVYVDYEKANRIFVNIISNAIKYTKDGGRVKVRCEQVKESGKVEQWKSGKVEDASSSAAPPSRYATYRYTFEDNGIGMSEEFQAKLYDRFSREENTTLSGVSGTGLGMAICKSFVDLMGGTIECRSRQGVGTTFTVTLPHRLQQGTRDYIDPATGKRMSADSADGGAQKTAGAASDRPFKGRRVLLVDDSKLNREVSGHFLRQAGFEVETAEDGSVAVERVREKGPGHYDVIMMDIQMPVMDGFEATRRIRAWESGKVEEWKSGKVDGASSSTIPPPRIPIIAWSANAFEEDRAAALAAGMNDHVAKGVKAAVLQECIAKYL